MPQPGQIVSHFRILEVLGRGGMGVVYVAEDQKLKRRVALKFLPPELSADKTAIERFKQEAQTASGLKHPNVCTIHEIGETSEAQLFLAMALYEGKTLKEIIAEGPLEVDRASSLIKQIAAGLAAAHGENVVHRDIKPANILITDSDRAVILDFGLAKLAGLADLTKTKQTVGTAAYMSPEQIQGESIDPRSDIWSLGVLLYEMLTGNKPFGGEYEQAMFYSILNQDPDIPPDTPEHLSSLIRGCLQKETDNRFQNAHEVLNQLENTSGSGSSATPSVPMPRLNKRFTLLALGVALVAVLFMLWQQSGVSVDMEALQVAVESGQTDTVFELLVSAGVGAGNGAVEDIVASLSGTLTVSTTPESALVSVTRVSPLETFGDHLSQPIGNTPLSEISLISGEYLVVMRLDNQIESETKVFIESGQIVEISRLLMESPPGMVLVEAGLSPDGVLIDAFWMDRTEITNGMYLAFVSDGGYRNTDLWVDGEYDLASFVDRSGLPGPRTWSGGNYSAGTENYPITGVSWIEATAYARWAGKELPSWDQWWRAALDEGGPTYPWGNNFMGTEFRSNFSLEGSKEVGSFKPGISPFGVHDMAGNVREWLQEKEEGSESRLVVGGSWQDPIYMFEASKSESYPVDYRGQTFGFRSVLNFSPE